VNTCILKWTSAVLLMSILAGCGLGFGGNGGGRGALQPMQLQAEGKVSSATLSWSNPNNASAFSVYVSSAPHCDIQSYSTCPAGVLLTGVTSPLTVEELRNGQAYFFRIDAMLSDGTHQLSNEASARPNALAFNGLVQAIAFGEDGTQYVGGEFTAVGIASGGAVPIDAVSGQPAMPDFPIVTGAVLATVSDGAGGWFIGGRFTQVGGQAHENLAHILANGTVDPRFVLDFNNSQVEALAFSGDTLYAGGDFTSIDGQQRNGLAAFGTDGTLRDWNPDAGGGVVLALAVAGDVVYAGGQFTSIGPQGNRVLRNRLAAIGADGTLLAWDPNLTDGLARVLEVSGNIVYVGGLFSAVGGVTRHNLAAISTAGELLDWNPDSDSAVTALAVAGNTVYASGGFLTVAGQARNQLAAIDVAGAGRLLDWHPDTGNGLVTVLKVAGSTVYTGGIFDSIDGIKRSNLAAIGIDGHVLAWNPAPNNAVLALAIADNMVFAGGQFTALASATRHALAAIDSHGRLTAWNPDVNASVEALVVAGKTVYAGGSFSQVAGETRNRLAAIGTDGALLDWNPGTDGSVFALAISGDTVYAGGLFAQVTTTAQGRQTRGSLAAIGTDGSLLDWSPSVNNTVSTLLLSGSTIYVGGTFTEIATAAGREPRNRLAAIGTGGKLSDWNPNPDAPVRALAIIDNTLYVGGRFANIGNAQRNHLAAIGTNGVLSNWQADTDDSVRALAVSGNTIYASGPFGSVTARNGLKQRRGLAAIDVNGDALDWNPDANSSANVLAVSGETVYAGGFFTTLGGLPRFFFGAIDAGGNGEVVP
jgi:WD40 repeat protein